MTTVMSDRNLRWVVAVTVTVIWSLSVIADFLSKDYDPGGAIHGVFTGIVGIALATPNIRRDGGEHDG